MVEGKRDVVTTLARGRFGGRLRAAAGLGRADETGNLNRLRLQPVFQQVGGNPGERQHDDQDGDLFFAHDDPSSGRGRLSSIQRRLKPVWRGLRPSRE